MNRVFGRVCRLPNLQCSPELHLVLLVTSIVALPVEFSGLLVVPDFALLIHHLISLAYPVTLCVVILIRVLLHLLPLLGPEVQLAEERDLYPQLKKVAQLVHHQSPAQSLSVMRI